MGTLKDRLATTDVPIEVWEELAKSRGTTLDRAEQQAGQLEVRIVCTGERISLVQAAALVGRHPRQIHRWIRMGAVHVYGRTGTKGPGAETIVDLGSVRSAAALVDFAGTQAVKAAVCQSPPLAPQIASA